LDSDILNVLRSVKDGKTSVEDAAARLRLLAVKEIEGACLDLCREARKGVPEIVFAESKSTEDLLRISRAFYEENEKVIITRVTDAQASALQKEFGGKSEFHHNERGRVIVIKKQAAKAPPRGKVAILTAGTSDIRVAEEARMVLEEMGCTTLSFHDVGIAGIQRLFPALEKTVEKDVDAIIVIAGMEGALPSVVSSLVSVPVIGVPSSSGYGAGGRGEGALISMLQSCSTGLVVVNIDNGVGAAVAAALIAKRATARAP